MSRFSNSCFLIFYFIFYFKSLIVYVGFIYFLFYIQMLLFTLFLFSCISHSFCHLHSIYFSPIFPIPIPRYSSTSTWPSSTTSVTSQPITGAWWWITSRASSHSTWLLTSLSISLHWLLLRAGNWRFYRSSGCSTCWGSCAWNSFSRSTARSLI